MIPTVLWLALAAGAPVAPVSHDLPVTFRNNRIFVVAHAPDGWALEFNIDSGGGFNAISATAAKRLALSVVDHARGDDATLPLVAFPPFLESAGVPRPLPDDWLHGNLAVAPDDQMEVQGFLGSRWFAGGVWQIDYGAQALRRLDGYAPGADDRRVALGFKLKPDGSRAMNFARVTVRVDGEAIDMLLDTGATARLTATSAAKLRLPEGTRTGASYIVASRFDAWKHRHPDWPVVDAGEAVTGHAFPMIEVPKVEIAGIASGPVWFSERPDATFRGWMSSMTDRPIDGAIGGSGLKYYRFVMDYPGAVAWFHSIDSRRP